MSIDTSLLNKIVPRTGVVILLFGNQVGADATVERTGDISGSADTGSWVEIAQVTDVEESGTPFFDYLPLTSMGYWYRAKATELGFDDSNYTTPVFAAPTIIPDSDWSSKPWLYDRSIPLQLGMSIVSESVSTITVSASLNLDPVELGTPTVSVQSYFGIPSAPTSSGGNVWIIERPSSGSGEVIFTNSLPGRLGDSDGVTVTAAGNTAPNTYQLILTTVSASADSLTVSASVADSFGGPYNVSIIAQQSVGTITNPSTNVWTIARPTSGAGTVTFLVTGSISVVPDTDTVYVTKDNLTALDTRVTVTSLGTNEVTASVVVRDPYQNTGTLSGITITSSSQAVSGLSSLFVGQTNTGGVITQTYHITRPNYLQGTGRVTWVASKTGYSPDSDSIEVPERVENLARLRVTVSPQGSTTTQQIVSVRVTDAVPLTGSYINLSTNLLGIPSISPTGSFLLSSSQAQQFTIERPAYGQGIGRVTFIATASNRVTDTDSIDISERDISTVGALGATITLGTITSGSASLSIPFSFDSSSTAQTVFVYTRESTTDIPLNSVEFTGFEVGGSPLYPNDGRTFISIPVSIPGNTLVTTFVPFDGLNRRGQVQTVKVLSLTGSLVTPDPFQTSTLLSSGSTFVSASVQMPASNLPDDIRLYLNGSPYGSLISRTAGAGASQTIVTTGLSPNTTYSFEFSGVNTNGAESTKTTALYASTPFGSTLVTPEVLFGFWEDLGGGEGLLYFYIENGIDYPEGTTFEGEVYTNPGPSLDGSISQTTSTTLTYGFTGPGSTTGTAVFRAKRTGYTTSADSTSVSWDNAGAPKL